jgi:hypothetical protein
VGLFRKMTSLSTLGAVDFKSDKERTASYTKAAAKEAKEQTRLMRLQAAQEALRLRARQEAQSAAQPVAPMPAPQLPPAGWYPDQDDSSLTRWFDGTEWTEFTQPRT